MTGLPSSWAVAPLGDLIAPNGIFTDGDWVESKDQDPNGDVRLIQLADIADSRFLDKSSRFLTRQKADELRCTFLMKGDLMVARMPDPLGRCCIFPLDGKERFVTVVDVCAIRVGSAEVDPRFLMRAINSPIVRAQVSALESGSTRKRISRKNLATVSIPVPPLNEQHRIAERIDALFDEIDRGVESLRDAKRTIDLYRQSLLKSAFEGRLTAQWRNENADKLDRPDSVLGRIRKERASLYQAALGEWEATAHWRADGERGKKPAKPKRPKSGQADSNNQLSVPTSWTTVPLRGIALEAVLGKMLDRQKNRGKPRIYLGNINLRWGSFNVDPEKKIPIEDHEVPRYGVRAGDLIICEGGEPGRCAVWDGDDNHVFIQKALHRVRFTPSYSSRFAYFFFKFATVGGHLKRHFTGSTIKHLTGTALDEILLPICCPPEQAEIVRILDSRLEAAETLDREIDAAMTRAEALRQSILKQAFSSKLVPQNPSDEPAHALLARIRASRHGDATAKPQRSSRRRARASSPP